ncbi:MAG TPA: formylglycine-generating enzyme family protein [Marinagarivorans sp.]
MLAIKTTPQRVLSVILLFTALAASAQDSPPPLKRCADLASLQALDKTLGEIRLLKSQLQTRHLTLLNRVMFPQFETERQRKAIKYWQDITAQTLFSRTQLSTTEDQLGNLQHAIAQRQCKRAFTQAAHLKSKIKQQLADFDAAEFLFDAKAAAQAAKADLVMYRMMKSVKGPAPKAEHAHHLFAKAQNHTDNGQLANALTYWRAATVAFNEDAFREVINEFKKHGNDATEHANRQLERIREKTQHWLNDYFVTIPEGTFLMGSDTGNADEKPIRRVQVQSFKMGSTEIPFALWDLCVQTRRCLHTPDDQGWGRATRPVINVSFNDITEQFIPWLSLMTGKQYRLPTEAEWEYAARAGTRSPFPWGDDISCTQARYNVSFTDTCASKNHKDRSGSYPVKSFPANNFGLYDMHGNVWEWTDNCYTKNYSQQPQPASKGQCQVIALRGGSWKDGKDSLRSANRFYFARQSRMNHFGFRLIERADE